MDNSVAPGDFVVGQPPTAQDEEHLRLLAVSYFVLGGLILAVSCFFIVSVVVGLMAIFSDTFSAPRFFGYLYAGVGTLATVGGWLLGGLTLFAGRCSQRRERYVYLLIIAALNCALAGPLGIVLGVFTFIVLSRPAMKPLFRS